MVFLIGTLFLLLRYMIIPVASTPEDVALANGLFGGITMGFWISALFIWMESYRTEVLEQIICELRKIIAKMERESK